jgi:hypothetical protein
MDAVLGHGWTSQHGTLSVSEESDAWLARFPECRGCGATAGRHVARAALRTDLATVPFDDGLA